MAKSSGNQKRAPVWEGANYARVMPGRYRAIAVRFQGPDWVRAYRRLSLLVEFELLGDKEEIKVCAFFNMGKDPDRPRAGRQSNYFKAWTIANGEPPTKGQEMTADVFLEGQIFEIEIDDCRIDSEEKSKPDAETYSRVTKIHSAQRNKPESRINSPRIRNHPNTQSGNQPIKVASAQHAEKELVSLGIVVQEFLSNHSASPVAGRGREQPKAKPKGAGLISPPQASNSLF